MPPEAAEFLNDEAQDPAASEKVEAEPELNPDAEPMSDETADRQAAGVTAFVDEVLKATEGETGLESMGLTEIEKGFMHRALKSFLMETTVGQRVAGIHGWIMLPLTAAIIAIRRVFYWRKKHAPPEQPKQAEPGETQSTHPDPSQPATPSPLPGLTQPGKPNESGSR